MTRLSQASLKDFDSALSVPTYDRSAVTRGIVHFGVGGFHRAHEAMYTDRLMEAGKGQDWGICGVGVLPHDRKIVETLNAQDGLYTLVIKHPDGERESRVIGSIIEMLFAPDDPAAVLEAMSDPATRIVSLTITEGGYLVNQVTGEFDAKDESIQSDLEGGSAPTTAFGFIVEALRMRREAGVDPFTVMSCDNLPGNGDTARTMITAFARLKDPDLADWMTEHVPFPNCMVDRITPVTSSEDIEALAESTGVEDEWPVVCEPFTQWVLEDDFVSDRPAWEEVEAQLVDDVVPFELMKLRLLNASHQALCYLGVLDGYTYAHEVCQDELFVKFLLGYMEHEGSATLPHVPDTDLEEYRQTLIERFANPEVRDTLARLCAESSDRIPKWLVPVIQHNLEHDGPIEHSALIVASWARYAEGEDEQGNPIKVVDRIKDRVMAAAAKQDEDPIAFLRDPDLFGNLSENERFTHAYQEHLDVLHSGGARASLERLVRP
ncbi:MAG: mannitol dehydrogenase family protein [Ornithinimicrobium sp.]